jgi:hypothetical protein
MLRDLTRRIAENGLAGSDMARYHDADPDHSVVTNFDAGAAADPGPHCSLRPAGPLQIPIHRSLEPDVQGS